VQRTRGAALDENAFSPSGYLHPPRMFRRSNQRVCGSIDLRLAASFARHLVRARLPVQAFRSDLEVDWETGRRGLNEMTSKVHQQTRHGAVEGGEMHVGARTVTEASVRFRTRSRKPNRMCAKAERCSAKEAASRRRT
jgi:hypothetical protein